MHSRGQDATQHSHCDVWPQERFPQVCRSQPAKLNIAVFIKPRMGFIWRRRPLHDLRRISYAEEHMGISRHHCTRYCTCSSPLDTLQLTDTQHTHTLGSVNKRQSGETGGGKDGRQRTRWQTGARRRVVSKKDELRHCRQNPSKNDRNRAKKTKKNVKL